MFSILEKKDFYPYLQSYNFFHLFFHFRVLAVRSKHTLPDLPFDYADLEPVISHEIMQLHHQKHHATYVNNLNQIEEKLHEAVSKGFLIRRFWNEFFFWYIGNLKEAIALQPALKFNGGGHINHSIFWTNLAKDGGEPSKELMDTIKVKKIRIKNIFLKKNFGKFMLNE